jgi:O-antigen ligase/polysaccharide polymerase Wzy-like membrane protein
MLRAVRQRLRSEGMVLVPALPAIALFVYWGAHQGGYLPTTWGPSALVILGLLVATIAGIGLSGVQLTRPAAIALAAFAAYVAWSYLSIAWAASPGDALEGSNRALLFLLLFALFAILPWRPWTACTALSAFALGSGTVALVTLLRVGGGGDVTGFFSDSRLVSPVGYVNGTAALFTTAAIVATALASRRELPVALRGLLAALATAALQTAVLCASRGWLFALPVLVVVGLLVIPNRVRLALWAALPIAGTLLALPRLLDVFERADAAEGPVRYARALSDAGASAVDLALPICGAILLAGLALALLDRRTQVPSEVTRNVNRAAAGLALLAALAGVVAGFAATDGRPDRKIADYWDRSVQDAGDDSSSHFASVGTSRPDFWRVSLRALEDRPLTGLGQDNWGDYYLLHRDSDEQPRWTHSLELRLLAHTGLVGFALFAAFVVAAAAGALRGRRRAEPFAVAAAAIALMPPTVWLVHGSIDWFWELPALSGPAFAFLGLATAVSGNHARAGARQTVKRDEAPPRERATQALLAGGAAALALLAALAIALPWLSERETVDAAQSWQRNPVDALKRLDRAAELNPLSTRPDLTAGVIALELASDELAQERFTRALDRDSGDWFAHFGRGIAESAGGDRAAARADFEQAHELNPGDPLIDEAIERLRSTRPLTAAEAFAQLRQGVARLTDGT